MSVISSSVGWNVLYMIFCILLIKESVFIYVINLSRKHIKSVSQYHTKVLVGL